MNYCDGLRDVINLVKLVFGLVKWGVPIILILFGTIDLGKAVMAGKEDEMKKAQSTLIKRVVYAVVIFFIVTIVTFAMNLVSSAQGNSTDSTSWIACWNAE